MNEYVGGSYVSVYMIKVPSFLLFMTITQVAWSDCCSQKAVAWMEGTHCHRLIPRLRVRAFYLLSDLQNAMEDWMRLRLCALASFIAWASCVERIRSILKNYLRRCLMRTLLNRGGCLSVMKQLLFLLLPFHCLRFISRPSYYYYYYYCWHTHHYLI